MNNPELVTRYFNVGQSNIGNGNRDSGFRKCEISIPEHTIF